jgi:hypothetical protein
MKLIVYGFTFFIILCVSSCADQPYACFSTNPPVGNIHVNQSVTFNAACTYSADSYYWQFYGSSDSINFGQVVTRVMYDTGNIDVYLLVTKGNKQNSTDQTIYVAP